MVGPFACVLEYLINLLIVSYLEVGTLLTPNHGHAALMGVFGMLAVAPTVFALRQVLTNRQWQRVERFVRVSFGQGYKRTRRFAFQAVSDLEVHLIDWAPQGQRKPSVYKGASSRRATR